MFKELHPTIRVRIFISFLSKIIGASVFPFMAIYFSNHLNAPLAGALLIINTTIQIIASFFGGYLADNIGRRRLQVVGEWIKFLTLVGMAIVNSNLVGSVGLTFVMLLIMSVAQGAILPATDAMLIDVSTPETRAYMYSINYWGSNLAMMIGIILGGWLFQEYMFNLLLFLASLSLVTAILTTVMITETLPLNNHEIKIKNKTNLKNLIIGYKDVLSDYRFLLYILGGIMLMSIEFQRDNYISVRLVQEFTSPPFLDNINIPISGIRLLSILTVLNMILIVILSPIISSFTKNNLSLKKMYTGFILFAIGYAVCSFANDIFVLFIATTILSIGELIYVPIRQSILSEIIDKNKRGAYMAVNGMVIHFGKLVASSCLLVSPFINKYMMGVLIFIFGLISIIFTEVSIKKFTRKKSNTVIEKLYDRESEKIT